MNPDHLPDLASEPHEPEPATGARGGGIWRWLFFGSLALLLAVVAFGAGMISERVLFAGGGLFERSREAGSLASDARPSADETYPLYTRTRELIEDEYFFRPTGADAEATFAAELERGAMAGIATAAATPVASFEEFQRNLDYGAVQGMTAALEDDYTVFLAPVDQAPLAEDLKGEYEGIGVWIDYPDGTYTIVSPIPGSPAEEAGLRPGDILRAADGVEITGMANDQAMDLIRGPAGTAVLLTIEREGEPELLEVEVERRLIAIPTVMYETAADGRVAVIRVGIFGDKTTEQLDDAVRRANEDGVAGIVLDLRGNGGGWVTAAQEMVGRFLPEDIGPALYEDSSPGEDNEMIGEPIVGGGQTAFDVPMAVLLDGGSASASEIVAGALRDYDRAVLVGQPTFGKGLVQRVHDFEDGSSARITFARWLTPNREPIPEGGLEPDVAVAMPDPPDGRDTQEERAVDLVLAAAGEAPVVRAATPAATPGATPAAPGATPAATPVR